MSPFSFTKPLFLLCVFACAFAPMSLSVRMNATLYEVRASAVGYRIDGYTERVLPGPVDLVDCAYECKLSGESCKSYNYDPVGKTCELNNASVMSGVSRYAAFVSGNSMTAFYTGETNCIDTQFANVTDSPCSADEHYYPELDMCYYYDSTLLSIKDATQDCVTYGTELAMPKTRDAVEFILTLVTNEYALIGVIFETVTDEETSEEISVPKWIDGTEMTLDYMISEMSVDLDVIVVSHNEDEDCIKLATFYTVLAGETTLMAHVCERNPTSELIERDQCYPGVSYEPLGKCYYYHTRDSYSNAVEGCANYGATLAMPKAQTELEYLSGLVESTEILAFIGGVISYVTGRGKTTIITWLDGTDCTIDFWESAIEGYPDMKPDILSIASKIILGKYLITTYSTIDNKEKIYPYLCEKERVDV